MEQRTNLAELQKDISEKLLSSKRLLDVLEDLIEDNVHGEELLIIVKSNIESAFDEIEECRKMVSILD